MNNEQGGRGHFPDKVFIRGFYFRGKRERARTLGRMREGWLCRFLPFRHTMEVR